SSAGRAAGTTNSGEYLRSTRSGAHGASCSDDLVQCWGSKAGNCHVRIGGPSNWSPRRQYVFSARVEEAGNFFRRWCCAGLTCPLQHRRRNRSLHRGSRFSHCELSLIFSGHQMESQAASPPQAGAGSAPAAQEKDELRRSLSQRQLTMIAIGGAIGVGLFLGSGLTIQLAGPGVIISYLLGAAIAAVGAFCLAEMG